MDLASGGGTFGGNQLKWDYLEWLGSLPNATPNNVPTIPLPGGFPLH